MATSHTVILTPIPSVAVTTNGTLPVSVLVSPRLSGGSKLGEFPDWLSWTKLIKEFGLKVRFECNGQTLDVALPVEQLLPEAWAEVFSESTPVRPFVFPDMSDQRVMSFSYRMGLSLLKSIYMTTGIVHPALEGWSRGDQSTPLEQLLAGLDVNWDPAHADKLRAAHGRTFDSASRRRGPLAGADPATIAADGTVPVGLGQANAGSIKSMIAEPFATFYHPPVAPPLDEDPSDLANLLDFHQALSSLNAYRPVQRALGLAFDVELPASFVATALVPYGTLSIVSAELGTDWTTVPAIPKQSVAYIHAADNSGQRVFFTAPRVTQGEGLATIAGMLALPANRYGMAQVDVDGGLFKAIGLAETVVGKPYDRRMVPEDEEGFDDTSSLATLRSAGFTLFADERALALLRSIQQSTKANEAATDANVPPNADTRFYAEDLVRGYRLDIWDSTTGAWRSLHQREAAYLLKNIRLPKDSQETILEEGFVQLAATTPSVDDGTQASTDIYLHEAVARWGGWSLSAPMPGKGLSRYGDPLKAVPVDDDPAYEVDPVVSSFEVRPEYRVARGSLPALRFGHAYRLRVRLVDLAGNGLALDTQLADFLGTILGLPLRPEGLPYLRFQPVPSPVVIARSTDAVTLKGGSINRIVIRTHNEGVANDGIAPDLTANDRHIAPPRCSVELGEQMGMLDDSSGRLNGSPAMWTLLSELDQGDFPQSPPFKLAGEDNRTIPLMPDEKLAGLPYLPDVLARGAAFRNLPGSGDRTRGKVAPAPASTGTAPVPYEPLGDPNPRPGTATLVGYAGEEDWRETIPFRFVLEEGEGPPVWDADNRVLKTYLPKGSAKTVLLSSYVNPEDLKLMGVWQWIREGIEIGTIFLPVQQHLTSNADIVAHILQRSVEGGHWMITPPRNIKLVHAVQQPVGIPQFVPITVRRADPAQWPAEPLLTMPEVYPTASEENAAITGWRRLNSTDAYLLGGLKVHGSSTAKVEIVAAWTDSVDDPEDDNGPGKKSFSKTIDELPLPNTSTQALRAPGKEYRLVGRYDSEEDTIQFLRYGDQLGSKVEGVQQFNDAAPRHQLGDTKHHVVNYKAIATSRYREYFDHELDFTRTGEETKVHVPASARPASPSIRYVVPTFGWQREHSTNVKRSVRFGGGLRVYLDRPWYSSGDDEKLAVVLAPSGLNLTNEVREEWKALITQWGQDPIWKSAPMAQAPRQWNFPDAAYTESALSLEERQAGIAGIQPGLVDVAAFHVDYDKERGLWYCDLTVDVPSPTYGAFIRLALARYQPYAIKDVKLSRVALADFAQLTPDRSAVVSSDPYAPGTLRVTVSGVAPAGPNPSLRVEPHPPGVVGKPTQITVKVQRQRSDFGGELGWEDAPASEATVTPDWDGPPPQQPNLTHWTGRVRFLVDPEPRHYRLLIEEHEFISANHVFTATEGRTITREQPRRLIYAEVFELDHALIEGPGVPTGTEL